MRKAVRRAHAENAERMGGDGRRIDPGTAARLAGVIIAIDAEHRRRARRTA
jgi:hypothetical protein